MRITPLNSFLPIVLLLALSACSTGGEERSTDDGFGTDLLNEQTSDYQRAILIDGVVDAAEYESALLAYRDCVEDVGGIPGPIEELGNNQKGFSFEVSTNDEAALQEIEARVFECESELFALVGQAWAEQNLLGEAERDSLKPAVIECLNSAGVPVAESDAFEDIVVQVNEALLAGEASSQSAINDCLSEYAAFFQTPRDVENAHEHEEE